MLFSILIYGYRAANISHDQYKEHYESTHIPLAKSLAGDTWPLSHTRYYYDENKGVASISTSVDWDSMAVLTFESATHASKFNKVMSANAAAIHNDEAKFMASGSPKIVVIGTDSAMTVP